MPKTSRSKEITHTHVSGAQRHLIYDGGEWTAGGECRETPALENVAKGSQMYSLLVKL